MTELEKAAENYHSDIFHGHSPFPIGHKLRDAFLAGAAWQRERDNVIKIGEFTIRQCEHGGAWISKEDGEGMQVAPGTETEKALIALLTAFWTAHY